MPDRTTARRYGPAALPLPQVLILTLLLASLLGANLSTSALGQEGEQPQQLLTGEQFLGPVIDNYGPQYKGVDDAVIAFQEKRFAEARDLLVKAGEEHPELAPGEVMFAQLALAANQQQMAAQALERAAVQAADDPEPFILLGQLALAGQRLAYADAMLDVGAEKLAGYTLNDKRKNLLQRRLLNGNAGVAEGRQQWDEANEFLAQWSELDPNSAALLRRWGVVKFRLKRYKEAFDDFDTLHKLEVGAPRPHINMANLHEAQGERARAQRFIDEVIKRHGKDEAETQLAAARWALGAGLYEKAREYARNAIELDPQSFDSKLIVGTVARALGEYAEAEQVFQAAVGESPSNFYARNNLALTLIEQTDETKRRRATENAQMNVRTFSDSRNQFGREAYATYAWVLYQRGMEAEAEATLARVVGAGQISPESAYYVAAILHGRNKTDAARQILQQALQSSTKFIGRDAAQELMDRIAGQTAEN